MNDKKKPTETEVQFASMAMATLIDFISVHEMNISGRFGDCFDHVLNDHDLVRNYALYLIAQLCIAKNSRNSIVDDSTNNLTGTSH